MTDVSQDKLMPLGSAGDAIDFAADHCAPDEAIAFLEDWRCDRASEWPGYVRWIETQQRGAAEARPPTDGQGISPEALAAIEADMPALKAAMAKGGPFKSLSQFKEEVLSRHPTDVSTDGLVERLRESFQVYIDDPDTRKFFNRDGLEAANRIEALERRNAELEGAATEAGHAAYSQGYKDGFVDAHVTDEAGWPDDGGSALLKRLDSTSMADGWQNYVDTFASSLGQSHIRGKALSHSSETGK